MLRKILIVDDNRINRQMLCKMLEGEYELLEAENGVEALKTLGRLRNSISAVLLDIVMPQMDGYEVLRRMRDDENLASIPVIVTTGNTAEAEEVKALSLGANDYVVKPYNLAIIKHRLHNTIVFRETAAAASMAKRDALTGLLNRVSYFELAATMIAAHEPGYYIMSCFDIDNFKVINDQYGSEKGDEVLIQVANTFSEGFEPANGICCRINADIFSVLYPRSFMETEAIAKIRRNAAVLDGSMSPISFSIGRYIVDDLSLSVSAMFDRASIAEDSVKGRVDVSAAIYDESMREEILRQQEITSEMNAALVGGEFEVWFQPQFNHATGALIGSEALVRWNRKEKGMISPAEFIPVFEQNGFIYEMDKFVWERTCYLLRKWIDAGRSPLPVSVNISRYDIFCDGFFETLTGIVEKYSIPIRLLHLEITESAFTESTELIIGVVKQLTNHGFTLEIDDFGSGYSSLNTLKDVPADVLKLDMRFLEGNENSRRGGNILESVIRMAKWLGMPIIAEGVETIEQADFLQSIGCNYMQGYLYAKPMNVESFEALASESGKEGKSGYLKAIEMIDDNSFWDPKSQETLVFNNYVGGACIFEYQNGQIEIIRINQKYAEELGGQNMTVAEALSIDICKHMDSANLAVLFDSIKQTIETGEESGCEICLNKVPRSKGSVYLKTVFKIIASAGDSRLFYASVSNVTAQREAEKKANAVSSQMRMIMESVNCGICATKLGKGNRIKYIFANEHYFTMLGYTREQFEKEVSDAFTIVHSDDRFQITKRVKDVFKEKTQDSLVYRCIKRNGDVIHVRCNTSISDIEGFGQDILLSVLTDITDIEEAERRVRETSSQLNAILKNVNGGVSASILTDDEEKYIFTNDEFFSMLGYTRRQFEEAAPHGLIDRILPEDLPMFYLAAETSVRTGEPAVVEYRVRRRDGTIINICSHSSVCYIEGIDLPIHISVSKDVSKEKENELRIIESASQLRFLNETAHELLANADADAGIKSVLRRTLNFFGGSRCFICEYNYQKKTFSNTYEVCAKGITPRKKNYQNLPLETVWYWLEAFKKSHFFSLSVGDNFDGERREEYAIYRELGADSVLAVSLIDEGRVIGTMGIFDPINHIDDYDDLAALGDYIAVILRKRDLDRKISLSNENLTSLMNDTPGGFVRMKLGDDGSFDSYYVNRGFCKLVGMNQEQIIRTYANDSTWGIHPEDIGKVRETVGKMINLGVASSMCIRLLKSNGIYIAVNVYGKLVKNAAGEAYLNLYCSDVAVESQERKPSGDGGADYERLRLLNNSVPVGLSVFETTPGKAKLCYFNESAHNLLGYKQDEYESLAARNPLFMFMESDIPLIQKSIRIAIASGKGFEFTKRVRMKSGEVRWINVKGSLSGIKENIVTVSVAAFDVTEQNDAEERLRMSEEQYRLALEHSGSIIFRYDVEDKSMNMTSEVAAFFSTPEKILDVPYVSVRLGNVSPESIDTYISFYEGIVLGRKAGKAVFRYMTAAGWRWFRASYSTIFSDLGAPVYAVVSYVDITDQRLKDDEHREVQRNERALKRRAEIDGMTGLYNKTTAELLIRQRLADSETTSFALTIVDLDDLKRINDTLGHPQGDKAIKMIADALEKRFRKTDIVGRIGGDEFVVFLDGISDEAKLREIMTSVIEKIACMKIGSNNDFSICASIGVTMGTAGDLSFEELYNQADKALYLAKRSGKKQFAVYSAEMEDDGT